MSFSVTDDAVRDFVERLRAGRPMGNSFPGKLSDCEFTPEQREMIRAARLERRKYLKTLEPTNKPSPPGTKGPGEPAPKAKTEKAGLTKLEKMLYLQGGKCFFCGEPLDVDEASIDHLLPLSHEGKRIESNEVACHRTVNEAFGSMDLKRKMEFILRSPGRFKCPNKTKPS